MAKATQRATASSGTFRVAAQDATRARPGHANSPGGSSWKPRTERCRVSRRAEGQGARKLAKHPAKHPARHPAKRPGDRKPPPMNRPLAIMKETKILAVVLGLQPLADAGSRRVLCTSIFGLASVRDLHFGDLIAVLASSFPCLLTSTLLAAAAVVLTGTISPAKAFEGFANPSVLLVVVAFLVAQAVVKCGLGRRISLFMVSRFGRSSLGSGLQHCHPRCLDCLGLPKQHGARRCPVSNRAISRTGIGIAPRG